MSLTVKILGDASHFAKTMNKVESNIGSLAKGVGAIGAAAATAAAGFAAWQGISFLKDSSKQAASFESLATSFEVLTGSAEKAAKLLKEITEFGANTPLEQGDLQQATQTLLAFGVSLEDVMPTLRMLGDVSMGNAERLRGLALVFGQVSANGRLMGGDVLQMVNQGFNPLLNISKRLNLSMAETKKKMEAGEISIQMVRQAFVDATTNGGQFEGMLAKIANTTEGKLSNLSDAIAQLKIQLGTGFNEGFKAALDAVNAFIPQLNDAFKKFGESLGAIIAEGIAGNKDALLQIGEFMGKMLWEGLVAGFKTAGGALGSKAWDALQFTGPIPASIAQTRRQNKVPSVGELIQGQLPTMGENFAEAWKNAEPALVEMLEAIRRAQDLEAEKRGVIQGTVLGEQFQRYRNQDIAAEALRILRGIRDNTDTSKKTLIK